MDTSFDLVIVGAGLAGLSTAYALRERKVCILEQELRPGGRVLSIPNELATLDLGACFAVGADVFPEPETAVLPQRLLERGPLRVVVGGEVLSGETAWDCIDAAPWKREEREALERFRAGQIGAAELPPPARRFVDALFKQIHPGEIERYIPERQRDSLQPLFPDHYPGGNRCAVDAYVKAIGDRLFLGTTVTSIEETPDAAIVHATTIEDGRRRTLSLRARAVVVATTVDVARRLVRPTRAACAEFLAVVDTATYVAVGLVFDAPALPRFRYVVSPDCPLNVVIQQASPDERHRALLCYYSDPCATTMAALSDDDLVERTVRHLGELHCDGCTAASLRVSAVKRWRSVGTILSPAYAGAKSADVVQATDRVFLAGDYVSRDPVWGYGTVDAVSSGQAAAAAVRQKLSEIG